MLSEINLNPVGIAFKDKLFRRIENLEIFYLKIEKRC